MAQVLSSVTRSELTSIPSNSLDASVIARYDRYTLGFDFNYPSIQLLRPEINGSNKPSILLPSQSTLTPVYSFAFVLPKRFRHALIQKYAPLLHSKIGKIQA